MDMLLCSKSLPQVACDLSRSLLNCVQSWLLWLQLIATFVAVKCIAFFVSWHQEDSCYAALPVPTVGGGCPAGRRLPAGVVARRVGPGWLGVGPFWEGCNRGIVGLLPSVLPAQSPQCTQNP